MLGNQVNVRCLGLDRDSENFRQAHKNTPLLRGQTARESQVYRRESGLDEGMPQVIVLLFAQDTGKFGLYRLFRLVQIDYEPIEADLPFSGIFCSTMSSMKSSARKLCWG